MNAFEMDQSPLIGVVKLLPTLEAIEGWGIKDGIMRPVQPPLPKPKRYSFTCGNCGRETILNRKLLPFDTPCDHCREYELEMIGEEAEQWRD